jgi:putative nucleotide binding protein
MQQGKREEEAIVLDFLPNGYPFDNRPIHLKNPVAQVIGTEKFTLLEVVPHKGVFLQPYEEVYIGEAKREQVHHINGRITVQKLTQMARAELEHVIDQIVAKHEARFVEFFNKAQPLSTRMHVLELLPGVGKKHMWEIIEERRGEPFTSFEEMRQRVKLMPDPKKAIVKRVLQEMEGNEKHHLFTEAPASDEDE